jgi:hypothetical protein
MSANQESPPGVRDLTHYGSRSPSDWDEIAAGKPAAADRAYYEDAIRLPGFGRQPERCMARKPVGFCDTHGHVSIASASPCSTRGCPEHSHMWRKDAAEAMVVRLAAYRQAQPDGPRRRLLHVVTSPDRSRRWTADAFWNARSASYDAVKAVGGRGGVTVPHAYRTSDAGDWLFEEAVERGDWERDAGKWSLLRDAADDWGEMLEFVEEAPHFHHLVAAEDFDTDAIPPGQVVKNIRSLDPFHLRDMTAYRDMAATAMYLLSHAGFEPAGLDGGGRNTVTYFGDVHPNGFDPAEELTTPERDTIQRMAERAVRTDPSEDAAATGGLDEPDRRSCTVDGCDGEIVEIGELREWLRDPEWLNLIGEKQATILEGAIGWIEEQGDRPPPSTDREKLRRFLYQRGEARQHGPRTEQSSLRSAL